MILKRCSVVILLDSNHLSYYNILFFSSAYFTEWIVPQIYDWESKCSEIASLSSSKSLVCVYKR